MQDQFARFRSPNMTEELKDLRFYIVERETPEGKQFLSLFDVWSTNRDRALRLTKTQAQGQAFINSTKQKPARAIPE